MMVTPVTYSLYSLFCQLQRRSPGSGLLGQHWDPPLQDRGHSRAWEARTEQDQGKPPLNLCPIPLPQTTQPLFGWKQPVPTCVSPGHPWGFSAMALSGNPNSPGELGTSAQKPAPKAPFLAQVPLCHPS